MGFKYTISELAKAFNCSNPTAEKEALRKGFKPCFKIQNNKEVKAFESPYDLFPDKEHADNENTSLESFETPLKSSENITQMQLNPMEVIEKVMQFSNDHINDLKNTYERVLKAESQQKLIEDSERRKDAEIHRLNASLKHLESKKNYDKYFIIGIACLLIITSFLGFQMHLKSSIIEDNKKAIQQKSDYIKKLEDYNKKLSSKNKH